MTQFYFNKNETNILRGIEKKCQICGNGFSIFKKEHQCKRCFRAVCADCGEAKVNVFKQGFARRPHRTCKICAQQSKQIQQFIESNRLSFSKMSSIGSKWIKKIQRRPINIGIDNKKYKKFTKQVFDKMWDSYNYSLREFIGLMTFQLDQQDVFRVLYDVYMTVISACPEQDMQCVTYLIMYLLCFCSPDKVPIICLYVIEMKQSVADQDGLIQAYFRALSISNELLNKMKDYLNFKNSKYINSLSINCTNVKCTNYIIDKVISRKKIDQLYMFYCLSIDINKDVIIKYRDNADSIDLVMVRSCSIDGVGVKYKQANMVKSIIFMKEIKEDEENLNSSIVSANEAEFSKNRKISSLLTNSFSEGVRENQKQLLTYGEMKFGGEEIKLNQIKPFRKKMTEREQEFTQDSFSMYSMIEQNKDVKNQLTFQNSQNQLLTLLNQVNQKSPNLSVDEKYENDLNNKIYEQNIEIQSPFKQFEDSNEVNGKDKQKDCQACASNTMRIGELRKQVQSLRKANERIDQYARENKQLKQKLRSFNQQNNQTQKWMSEKSSYQTQIKKLKQVIKENQNRERQFETVTAKYEEARKNMKKLQTDIRVYQQQSEEMNMTLKMWKNKAENQTIINSQIKPASDSGETAKMLQMLKQTVRQKNQNIEEITKRNKLLIYQIEELTKNKLEDKEKMALEEKNKKIQKEKADLMLKFQQLSVLLMQEEGEKLNLSQQNFSLRELLKAKGINLANFNY